MLENLLRFNLEEQAVLDSPSPEQMYRIVCVLMNSTAELV